MRGLVIKVAWYWYWNTLLYSWNGNDELVWI